MMKNHSIPRFTKTTLALSLGLLAASTQAATCQNPTPIWADEFNGSSLDTSKWEIMTGDGCSYGICGWGNNELQSYQADNLAVANGILSITARKERAQTKAYTSGRIRTANMPNGGEWRHGRFEARIKLPSGAGTWPAFWMLPTDPSIGWPMSGEIDIMEATGQADMIAFGTIHYGQAWPNNEFSSSRILKQPDAWSDDFHTYAVEWESGELRWYIDDILYATKTPADLSNPAYWTFDNYDYHFLLNLAVGGSIGGWVDDSTMPQTMQVDYVRVYDLGQPAIQGEHIVEPGSSHTYSVVDKTGQNSTFSWTGPDGQTSSGQSFSVNWGDTSAAITVTVTNSCGSRELSLPVHVQPAQESSIVLDNYETSANVTYSFATGALQTAVANPAPDALNSSASSAKYVRDASSAYDVLVAQYALADAAPFISGENAFYLDVYTNAPVGTEFLLQLENSATAQSSNYPVGRHSKFIAHTEVQGQWQRLKFQMEDRLDGATLDNQVDNLVLLIDPNAMTGDTYFLDNFAIYAPKNTQPPTTATSLKIQSVTTSTVSVGQGKKQATAAVVVRDNLGNPVANMQVLGKFSGSWNEQAIATTGADGIANFTTSSSLGGNVSASFCVIEVNSQLPLDTANSQGVCQ